MFQLVCHFVRPSKARSRRKISFRQIFGLRFYETCFQMLLEIGNEILNWQFVKCLASKDSSPSGFAYWISAAADWKCEHMRWNVILILLLLLLLHSINIINIILIIINLIIRLEVHKSENLKCQVDPPWIVCVAKQIAMVFYLIGSLHKSSFAIQSTCKHITAWFAVFPFNSLIESARKGSCMWTKVKDSSDNQRAAFHENSVQ